MKKKFNTTGTCYPELHYMMDTTAKMKAVMALIEEGEYFTINRPRQYGKTTTLHFLNNILSKSKKYMPVRLNFQGIDQKWHTSSEAFAVMFINKLTQRLKFSQPNATSFLDTLQVKVQDMDTLSDAITAIVHHFSSKIVLLIDEVDASSNYLAFLSFLAMLRTKYLDRFEVYHATFHSIVLAGVHDIKTLKYKMRSGDKAEYNSPWNIAADFKVIMSFNPQEIAPMLEDYTQKEGIDMNFSAIAERLYYHTSGYPFLVSKICKIIAEDILPTKTVKTWTLEAVEQGVRLLLKENNTNFDSLIKNLENHKDLYSLVYRTIVESENIPFNQHNPSIHLGILHGIFKSGKSLQIHNRIYEQIIYNYMISRTLTKTFRERQYDFNTAYVNKDKTLNIEGVLLRFQQFMKEQYSGQDQSFLEREWRLIFLAFLKPIINGKGHDFKEPQISEEKRLDIVITYFQYKYIIELKRWYGDSLHQNGIEQLCDYLDKQHQTKGYLVIFEHRTAKTWRQERIPIDGKEIFAVWI
ncbi:MAG: AAA-like domain-containing protein [Chitinophagales bacterium]